ncbi:MAG: hypothetical protein FH756_15150 [Firmicutes bacterium]|nr:hypothetical protein [Bacillota bacterium]
MVSKTKVEYCLQKKDFDYLLTLARKDKRVVRHIFRYLYSVDELVRKRAIEALGMVSSVIAERDTWSVRNILRQLLWSVTEESGGIGWSAPEAMAEIVKKCPEEFYDYGSIAVSYLDEELLRRSCLWAAGTLGELRPEFIKHVLPGIIKLLDNNDPTVRGYAARALLAVNTAGERLHHFKNDNAPVQVYEDGELRLRTVAELAGHIN